MADAVERGAERPATPAQPAEEAPPPPRRSRWRTAKLPALAVIVLAVALGAVFGSRLDENPRLIDSPLIGRPVADVTLPRLESDGSLSLGDLRGQILVVNFWASWCVACREEHPALTAASEAYRASGVQFIGVSFQDQKSAAVGALDEMGRGEGYEYVTDPDSRAAVEFGVYGVPETFFIDRSGTIVAKITGASDSRLLADVLDAILAGRTPASVPDGRTQSEPTGPGQ